MKSAGVSARARYFGSSLEATPRSVAMAPLLSMLSLAVFDFSLRLWFRLRPTPLVQAVLPFVWVLLCVATLWAAVRWFRFWARERWWTIAPIAALWLSAPAASELGHQVDHLLFDHDRNTAYEPVVERIRSQELARSPEPVRITDAEVLSLHPEGVVATRNQAGALTVAFVRGKATSRQGMDSQVVCFADVYHGPPSVAADQRGYWSTAIWLDPFWSDAAK